MTNLKAESIGAQLAFDNAISKQAAAIKGIRSPAAGEADILLTPVLEAGIMLAKQLAYLSKADSAGSSGSQGAHYADQPRGFGRSPSGFLRRGQGLCPLAARKPESRSSEGDLCLQMSMTDMHV